MSKKPKVRIWIRKDNKSEAYCPVKPKEFDKFWRDLGKLLNRIARNG